MKSARRVNHSDVKGYYLITHAAFMRLITEEDRERLELKLVTLTMAGCMLRTIQPRPTVKQLDYLYAFVDFLVNHYPEIETVRPAISHFYGDHQKATIDDLMLVGRLDEFASNLFSEIIASDPLPQFSVCMLTRECPVTILSRYKALLWDIVLDHPEMMAISPAEYALEMLINLRLLREGASGAAQTGIREENT